MTVETYSDKYFLDVVKLVENFHQEAVGEYDNLLDINVLIQAIKNQALNNSKDAFLLIVDGRCQGILFGTRYNSTLNNRVIFQEIIWYVNEPFRRYGVRLLKEVEKSLKSQGVSSMIMVYLHNSKSEKLKDFYVRLGYRPMETHLIRSL